MTYRPRKWFEAGFPLGISLALLLGGGCAQVSAGPARYFYFTPPSSSDAWSPKIAAWQRRETIDVESSSAEKGPLLEADGEGWENPSAESNSVALDLRSRYSDFKLEQKRSLARSVAEWVQARALDHYFADGPIDHWATLEETLARGGDDCDGLELLTYHALRDLGFGAAEVFRAIVYRASDEQHHMVTLWFEEEGDPWVIDPTGVMASGMPRMSDLPGWVPIKLFTATSEHTVLPAFEVEGQLVLAGNPSPMIELPSSAP
jgi:predicted transglutaminase-like cysteine proteinase